MSRRRHIKRGKLLRRHILRCKGLSLAWLAHRSTVQRTDCGRRWCRAHRRVKIVCSKERRILELAQAVRGAYH